MLLGLLFSSVRSSVNFFLDHSHLSIVLLLLYLYLPSWIQAYKLRQIPGPWHARITALVISFHTYRNTRTSYIHSQHQKYGTVVILAPDEIHVNDPALLNAIYSSPKVDKDPYYAEFTRLGTPNLFSTIDPMIHAKSRKHFNSLYSRQNLNLEAITECIALVVERLRESDGEAVDMSAVFENFTNSVITRFVFGRHFDIGKAAERNKLRDLKRFCRRIGLPLPAHIFQRLESWTKSAVPDAFEQSLTLAATTSIANHKVIKDSAHTHKPTLVWKMMQAGVFTEAQIMSEARDHVIAGSDTTTTILTFILLQLSLSPVLLTTIRQSLESIDLLDYEQVEKVEPLRYLVDTGIRKFASIPMTLPRLTNATTTIGGFQIPANTKCGAQAYSLHRLSAPYPIQESQSLDQTNTQTKIAPSLAKSETTSVGVGTLSDVGGWSFSSGSRKCIGRSLAIVEITWLIATLATSFEFTATYVRDVPEQDVVEVLEGFAEEEVLAFGMGIRESLVMKVRSRPNRLIDSSTDLAGERVIV